MAQRGGARPGAGRKKGKVSKLKRDLAEMARDHALAALQTLVDIAGDRLAPHTARVSAANAILDRGYGRPPQALEHTGKDGAPLIPVRHMSDGELEAIAMGAVSERPGRTVN